jgi:hypothetical protein
MFRSAPHPRSFPAGPGCLGISKMVAELALDRVNGWARSKELVEPLPPRTVTHSQAAGGRWEAHRGHGRSGRAVEATAAPSGQYRPKLLRAEAAALLRASTRRACRCLPQRLRGQLRRGPRMRVRGPRALQRLALLGSHPALGMSLPRRELSPLPLLACFRRATRGPRRRPGPAPARGDGVSRRRSGLGGLRCALRRCSLSAAAPPLALRVRRELFSGASHRVRSRGERAAEVRPALGLTVLSSHGG